MTTGMCEPIAFEGTFLGTTEPDMATLRMPIGQGLTGWVAANGRPLRLGDATRDPRGRVDRRTPCPSRCSSCRWSRRSSCGASSSSPSSGTDRFDADDEVTLTIFAAAAVQAVINAENMERLRRQQAEMELQLEGQRRLLEVNERLLSTLDPAGVLELIADSLRAIVPYDSLTIYRVDRDGRRAPRGHRP